jgi:hypothetical protein
MFQGALTSSEGNMKPGTFSRFALAPDFAIHRVRLSGDSKSILL